MDSFDLSPFVSSFVARLARMDTCRLVGVVGLTILIYDDPGAIRVAWNKCDPDQHSKAVTVKGLDRLSISEDTR